MLLYLNFNLAWIFVSGFLKLNYCLLKLAGNENEMLYNNRFTTARPPLFSLLQLQ